MVGMDLINYLTRHFGSDSIRVACETTGYRMGILMANSNPAPGNLSFPKLLVVAAFPPNAPTLNIQCLKGYPPERIYWWSYLPEITAVYGQKYATQTIQNVQMQSRAWRHNPSSPGPDAAAYSQR